MLRQLFIFVNKIKYINTFTATLDIWNLTTMPSIFLFTFIDCYKRLLLWAMFFHGPPQPPIHCRPKQHFSHYQTPSSLVLIFIHTRSTSSCSLTSPIPFAPSTTCEHQTHETFFPHYVSKRFQLALPNSDIQCLFLVYIFLIWIF